MGRLLEAVGSATSTFLILIGKRDITSLPREAGLVEALYSFLCLRRFRGRTWGLRNSVEKPIQEH